MNTIKSAMNKGTMNMSIVRVTQPDRHDRKSAAVVGLVAVGIVTIGLWGGLLTARAAEKICYGRLWQKTHTSPGRVEVVFCTNDCVVSIAHCYEYHYDPDGLVETRCETGSSETGVDCVYAKAKYKKTGQVGVGRCYLDETGRCRTQCTDWAAVPEEEVTISDDSVTYDDCRTPPTY